VVAFSPVLVVVVEPALTLAALADQQTQEEALALAVLALAVVAVGGLLVPVKVLALAALAAKQSRSMAALSHGLAEIQPASMELYREYHQVRL